MREIEYIAPNGEHYLVSEIGEEFSMPFPGGASGVARTIVGRRWVKSRQAFAKHPQPFTIRSWSRWTKA